MILRSSIHNCPDLGDVQYCDYLPESASVISIYTADDQNVGRRSRLEIVLGGHTTTSGLPPRPTSPVSEGCGSRVRYLPEAGVCGPDPTCWSPVPPREGSLNTRIPGPLLPAQRLKSSSACNVCELGAITCSNRPFPRRARRPRDPLGERLSRARRRLAVSAWGLT